MDKAIFNLIEREGDRQKQVLEMIPSENYCSKQVLDALGSVLVNKYSEGYSGHRYYQGNQVIDEIENLAMERAKELFGVPYANVQPYSGSPANAAVYFALLNPGDTLMGMSLSAGGHLTHGHPDITFSGKYFKSIQYGVYRDPKCKMSGKYCVCGRCGFIDYDEVERMALLEKPKIIVCGATAYPRIFDFERFGKIADKVGAYLLADISHIAGLIVGEVHPSPVPYADIVMTTTHKTLRGPRGAILMVTKKGAKKDPDLAKKIDRAVFPGFQGGPHDNNTAAIAVCLNEAAGPEFKKYAKAIVKNAKALAKELTKYGYQLVSNGTENHLLLIDFQNLRLNGAIVAEALEMANIVVNKNSVPGDSMPPFYPSGIRLGTPAITTRGMTDVEMVKIGAFMDEVLREVRNYKTPLKLPTTADLRKFIRESILELSENEFIHGVGKQVAVLTKKFPVPA